MLVSTLGSRTLKDPSFASRKSMRPAAYDPGTCLSLSAEWTTQLCARLFATVSLRPKLETAGTPDDNKPDCPVCDNNNWFAAWAFWQ